MFNNIHHIVITNNTYNISFMIRWDFKQYAEEFRWGFKYL